MDTLPTRLSLPKRAFRFSADLWRYAWSDDRRAIQIVVAGGCVFVTTLIGYAYAKEFVVRGWQLWVWLICCVLIIAVLAPLRVRRVKPHKEMWALLAVMITALLLRVILLEMLPGKLHTDEYGTARFTLEQIGTRPDITLSPFVVSPGSHPTLYHYLVKLFMAVFGYSIAGVRSSSVLAGTLAIAATYACVAVYQNRRAALMAAILMATYHYHIHWSRLALNNIWDTVWIPAMLAAYGWGWKNRNSAGAALAGAALGFSQYFYQGGRVGLVLLLAVIAGLWWRDRDARRLIIDTGKLGAVAWCIAAPLALFALQNSRLFFERFNVVFGWRPEVIQEITGSATDYGAFFWHQLWRSFGAYTAVVDITGFYRPEIPLTLGLAAPLLIIGFLWAIRQRVWLPVIWLLVATLLGGFMLAGAPSSSHYISSIPAICWLIAVVLDWLAERGHTRWAMLALAAIVFTDIAFYFGFYAWQPSLDLKHDFPVHLIP
jgi:4-amino-4-deoxy-L-arabinose transferase-like glycosyltransferase